MPAPGSRRSSPTFASVATTPSPSSRPASRPSRRPSSASRRNGSRRRSRVSTSGLRDALAVAQRNVAAVADAELRLALSPAAVELEQGQSVAVRSAAVAAAGVYAPGGRGAYPSSVLMCAVPARAAGVEPDRRHLAARPRGRGRRDGPRRLRDGRDRRGLRRRRRPGDRRARLRHRDGRSRRHDRRARQPLRHRGQAPGLGRGRESTASPARAS